jgi:hypothetical protein
MTRVPRARIDRIRVRVRAPMDRAGAAALAADLARALPGALGDLRARSAGATDRVDAGAVGPGPQLAARVAAAVGAATTGGKR